jgi:hypothetical protein
MDCNIIAHFNSGVESSKQPLKSIVFPVENGTKSALTNSLVNFQKEVNTFLTECIEKLMIQKTSAHVDGMYSSLLY